MNRLISIIGNFRLLDVIYKEFVTLYDHFHINFYVYIYAFYFYIDPLKIIQKLGSTVKRGLKNNYHNIINEYVSNHGNPSMETCLHHPNDLLMLFH